MTKKHLVIPDCQVRPGVNTDHLEWAGKYIAEKRPDTIICIGDFADMASLSSYDVGTMEFEGRSYRNDIDAAKTAMERLVDPFSGIKGYNPRMVLTMGNHENRIDRAISKDRKLEGLISTRDLCYTNYGWEVHDFLEPVQIDGISYCHYFVTGVMGRPVTSARALVIKKHMSCTMGHVQHTELDMSQRRADGTPIIGLFAGSFFMHDEKYLGPQGNPFHRQLWMAHEVENGSYFPMPVSIQYLCKKYTGKKLLKGKKGYYVH